MKRRTLLSAAAVAAATTALHPHSALAKPKSKPRDGSGATPEERAEELLARMSRQDKTALLCCDFDAVAGLGIPPILFADASAGVRGETGVTAFPVPVAQTATFDPDLLGDMGAAIAGETRGKGFNSVLGPTVDLARTWRSGRTAEGMGEDPHLAGRLGAEIAARMVEGHVGTTIKHFSAYNQERDRLTVDVRVSERALHETHHEPFRYVIDRVPETSVMTSYPRINGVYAPQNPGLLDDLKNVLGLRGYAVPDFFSGDDQVAAAEAGMDLVGLGADGVQIPPEALDGLSAERLDDAARRILVTMFAGGLFDHPVPPAEKTVSTAAHRELAREIAVHSTVLLDNSGSLLPLAQNASVAVIGPAGTDFVTGIEGSTWVEPGEWTTPLQAVRDRAGGRVTHAQGSRGDVPLDTVPSSALRTPDGDPGLRGAFYGGPEPQGTPVATAVAGELDFTGAPVDGLPQVWSARWSGTLTAPADGLCRFSLLFSGRARLVLDGETVIDGVRASRDFQFGPHTYPLHATRELTAGQEVEVVVEYTNDGSFIGATDLRFGWQPESAIPGAVAAAGAADTAVVVVNRVAGENMDHPSLALPGDQDALVRAVAAANPNTVVVLNTDGPVLMPWLDDVGAVVQTWYGGAETGPTLASVLYGDADPAGRLPLTFPASEEQGPGASARTYPGVDGAVHYDEGPDIGYRYYQRHGQTPLFPFGHGLSYTSFEYSSLGLHHDKNEDELVVGVNVRNTGDRGGHEVVQLYVGLPDGADAAPAQLKAFRKVRLDPGRLQRVELVVPLEDLRVWDGGARERRLLSGLYRVRVGRSSADLPLERTISLG
ncbi:beta-glucosidase [Nocardiopsis sp. TSRI0078]|uniref:beta-glucosidase H n=1 Tax=unclassified Nocardiopsis TaxID=2649073 RepID=UPI00093A6EB8|nr:glycoside hydrolase family 3 C-terminal domain-containing protein [Nocardiopsis sp. TSRI0078]OKI15749.1 beta-glucosidase [Nocardiopsis sp. TSRI0078]